MLTGRLLVCQLRARREASPRDRGGGTAGCRDGAEEGAGRHGLVCSWRRGFLCMFVLGA